MTINLAEVSLFGESINTVFSLDGDGMPRVTIGQMDLSGHSLTADQLRDIAALLERYADEVDRLEGCSSL